jgi:hypothetical protein
VGNHAINVQQAMGLNRTLARITPVFLICHAGNETVVPVVDNPTAEKAHAVRSFAPEYLEHPFSLCHLQAPRPPTMQVIRLLGLLAQKAPSSTLTQRVFE